MVTFGSTDVLVGILAVDGFFDLLNNKDLLGWKNGWSISSSSITGANKVTRIVLIGINSLRESKSSSEGGSKSWRGRSGFKVK